MARRAQFDVRDVIDSNVRSQLTLDDNYTLVNAVLRTDDEYITVYINLDPNQGERRILTAAYVISFHVWMNFHRVQALSEVEPSRAKSKELTKIANENANYWSLIEKLV